MTNKKDSIIDAAIRRIADQGCTFTTGQIASDIDCSQSLIFRYYPSKESLESACFEKVCNELRMILKNVDVPERLTRETIDRYLIDLWEAYCRYLNNNTHIAKAYVYFVSIGRRFPRGYRSAESVLKRTLEDEYDRIVDVYPDFAYAAEYIVMMSNITATGKYICWNGPGSSGKLDMIVKHGILGLGRCENGIGA